MDFLIKDPSEKIYQEWGHLGIIHLNYMARVAAKLEPLSLLEKQFIMNCVEDHPLLAQFQELQSVQELR